MLSHEQFPTQQLVDFGTAAERARFDGLWTSDHTWRDWLVRAEPMAHVKRIRGLWDAGATHVFVHSGNSDQMRTIDFYRDVIRRLRP